MVHTVALNNYLHSGSNCCHTTQAAGGARGRVLECQHHVHGGLDGGQEGLPAVPSGNLRGD